MREGADMDKYLRYDQLDVAYDDAGYRTLADSLAALAKAVPSALVRVVDAGSSLKYPEIDVVFAKGDLAAFAGWYLGSGSSIAYLVGSVGEPDPHQF